LKYATLFTAQLTELGVHQSVSAGNSHVFQVYDTVAAKILAMTALPIHYFVEGSYLSGQVLVGGVGILFATGGGRAYILISHDHLL
jgi:hypothetical protein